MVKVIQMGAINPRGLRNVIDGEAELLLGFEFNIHGKLATSISATFTGTIDRVTSDATIDIPAFVPTESLAAPAGSMHYKLVSAAMEINFENGTYMSEKNKTAVQPVDSVLPSAAQVTHVLPAASVSPLFPVCGINFYQQINGTLYELKKAPTMLCRLFMLQKPHSHGHRNGTGRAASGPPHSSRLPGPRGFHRKCAKPYRRFRRKPAMMCFESSQRISAVSVMALIVLLQIETGELVRTVILAGIGGISSYLFRLAVKFLLIRLRQKFKLPC